MPIAHLKGNMEGSDVSMQSLHALLGAEAKAIDGPIGSLFDVFFDDEAWHIRYVVIDTGTWITSEKILLAVESVGSIDVSAPGIHVRHPRSLIEQSPKVNLANPVTHFEENMVRRHYGAWPHWAPYHVGAGPHKLSKLRDKAAEDLDQREHIPSYALHSVRDPNGFHVQLRDDVKEKVVDLLFDPATWEIQRFVFRHGPAGRRQAYALDRGLLTEFDREAQDMRFDADVDDAALVDEASHAQ